MALTADAPSAEKQFRLTEDVDGLLLLIVGSEEIDITITSPDGVARTPEEIVATGGMFEKSFQEEASGLLLMPAGHHYAIGLPSAEQGLYIITAAAKATPTEPVGVMIMPMPSGGSLEAMQPARGPEISFSGTSQSPIFAGVPNLFVFEALESALPIAGVTASQRFVMGAEEQTIELRDDGQGGDLKASDGIYSASYTPSAPGPLQVFLQANVPGWPAPLEQDWPLAVEPAPARVIGQPQTVPVDDDGDGRFESLAVNAEVEVITASRFGWAAVIDYPGAWGPEMRASQEEELEPGRHHLSARFPIYGGLPSNASVFLRSNYGTRQAIAQPVTGNIRAELSIKNFSADPAGIESMLARLDPERRASLEPYLETYSGSPHKVIQQFVMGPAPALAEQSLAEALAQLTGPVSIAPIDRDGDGSPDAVVLSAPLRLAPGALLTNASLMTKRPGFAAQDPLTAETAYDSATGLDRIEIVVPLLRFVSTKFTGPAPVTLRLRTTAGDVVYEDVAEMPAVSLEQVAAVEPRVLSFEPAKVERGKKTRIVVRTQGIDVTPSSWGPRFEIDGLFETEIISSGEPDSFFVDVEVRPDAYPTSFDVEIVARNFRQTFPNGFTVLGFPVQFTGNNRTFSHDSDGDGVADKIGWEFEVESAAAVRVLGTLTLEHPYGTLRSEALVPEGKSFVRFYGSPQGHFMGGSTPESLVEFVTLREPHGHRSSDWEAELREAEFQVKGAQREDFVWPQLNLNGEITSREVDDDGDGLFDRVLIRVPFTAEDKQPLLDVRMRADVGIGNRRPWSKAFATAERVEIGDNVIELSVDGEELSHAAAEGPLRIGAVQLTAKNTFWRQFQGARVVETKPYSGAQFRKARPRLVQLFADGEGGREIFSVTAGQRAQVAVMCKFAECPAENLSVSSESDITIEKIHPRGAIIWLDLAVAADAPEGWRPVSIQTSAGLLTLPEAFLVRRPE